MEGLFQSSRVIRIAALHFTIRTCIAKFQPIPTGAIREIAPLGFGGKSQLSVTKPAGPLPRRLYETIWRCHARPPRHKRVVSERF